jgi:hypothetical protein
LRTLPLCTCCRHYPGAATGCIVCSLPQPCQPSPIRVSGRPAHRPFRGLLGVHSRYGLYTRTVTVFRDSFTEGFNRFVTSTVAPVASGWSILPGGIFTHWKAPPFHGAPLERTFILCQEHWRRDKDPERRASVFEHRRRHRASKFRRRKRLHDRGAVGLVTGSACVVARAAARRTGARPPIVVCGL